MTNKEIQYWHDLTKYALEIKPTNSKTMQTFQSINRNNRATLNKKVSINDYLDFSSVKKVITPNITNSEQDIAILNRFTSIFYEITRDVKAYYYDNMLIPESNKPKSIQYSLYLTNDKDKFRINGNITFKNDATYIKNIPLENIIVSRNFKIKNTQVKSDTFYIDYDLDNDNELKEIIVESMMQNQSIIECIQNKVLL